MVGRFGGGWDPSYRNYEDGERNDDEPGDVPISEPSVESGGLEFSIDDEVKRLEQDVSQSGAKSRLIELYNHPPKPFAKHLAGRALKRSGHDGYSYSPIRLFVHEHPIVITGAAFGLIYGLFDTYFNR